MAKKTTTKKAKTTSSSSKDKDYKMSTRHTTQENINKFFDKSTYSLQQQQIAGKVLRILRARISSELPKLRLEKMAAEDELKDIDEQLKEEDEEMEEYPPYYELQERRFDCRRRVKHAREAYEQTHRMMETLSAVASATAEKTMTKKDKDKMYTRHITQESINKFFDKSTYSWQQRQHQRQQQQLTVKTFRVLRAWTTSEMSKARRAHMTSLAEDYELRERSGKPRLREVEYDMHGEDYPSMGVYCDSEVDPDPDKPLGASMRRVMSTQRPYRETHHMMEALSAVCR